MELSQTYSKNYLIVAKYIKEYHATPVNTNVDPFITDLSYDPQFYRKIRCSVTKNSLRGGKSNNHREISAGQIYLRVNMGIWLP